MPGAFQLANDSIFADSNIGVDAVFTPSGGQPYGVRLVWEAPDESEALVGMRTRQPKTTGELRVSQITGSPKGGQLTVDGVTYTVAGANLDDQRLNWLVDLRP